jgi:hypothetical protein
MDVNKRALNIVANVNFYIGNHFTLENLMKNSYFFAVLNAILENNEVADLFFETVTTQDSENVIGLTLYGIRKQLSR